jgi:hypothetical protein
VKNALLDFPEEKRRDKPAGMASVAFHLQHLAVRLTGCLLMQR